MMSWQERDYAREPQGPPRGLFGRRGGGLWGGSIVMKLLVANIVVYVLCHIIVTPLSPLLRGTEQRGGRWVLTPVGPRPVYEYRPGYGEMITSKVLQGQVWRLFTSQYLHANETHIIFNMFGLYFLGQALERVWSRRKFFAIYTIAGVCGNLLLMAAGLVGWISRDTPAVGASGCILGLLGAAAVLFPHAEVFVYMLFPIKIRTAAIVFALMYAFNVYRQGPNYGGDLCHLAGLAFGTWWAWRGDRWWTLRRHARVPVPPPPPQTPVWTGVGEGPWGRKVERRVADEQAVDRVLAKVREGGITTLTDQEKKILLEATERLRQEEARAGRVDRL